MRSVAASFALLCLGGASFLAYGQTCPHGYMPLGGQQAGWVGCAPISTAEQAPVDPGPSWSTRWGAIAVDGRAGKFAGVDGHATKRRANKAALAECKKNGGKKCQIVLSYYNQCGAMAWGSTSSVPYRAPQQQQAIDGAMEQCGTRTDSCQIYYAGCSYPQRIR